MIPDHTVLSNTCNCRILELTLYIWEQSNQELTKFIRCKNLQNSFSYCSLHLLLFNGQDSTAPKKQKNGIAAIPMINYNRTQGIIVGAIVSELL